MATTKSAVKRAYSKIGPPPKFEIVKATDVHVLFEDGRKRSYYYDAICEFQRKMLTGDDSYLVFPAESNARPQLASQAKKHGIKLLFAEKDGKLYCKIEGPTSAEAIARDFIKGVPKTKLEIVDMFSKRGMLDVKVDEVMRSLMDSGYARLETLGTAKKYVWQDPPMLGR